MRYPASEKLEIIRLVEGSHLPIKRTLEKLGVPRSTFHRWYDRYQALGEAGLEDRRPHPGRVWNRIPDDLREAVVDLALDEPELSPRELAVRFTDTRRHFVSEASVYRILKAQDLITSPAFVVIKAADEFHDKTTRPNQLWQTDFTYLKVTGWGWYYLSTVLDDFSRYVIAWKLCTTMRAEDVTATLNLALEASGCDWPTVLHRPRLLSDNGSSYVAGDLARWLKDQRIDHVRGAPNHPQTQRKHARGWGRRRMRYPASEKLEIIRLVEGSHLPIKRTLEKLGVPRSTFHRWYDRYQALGEAGLEDRRPHPGRVWNRIPDDLREAVVDLALDEPELSPRELAGSYGRVWVTGPIRRRVDRRSRRSRCRQ